MPGAPAIASETDRARPRIQNRLNDLTPREWIRFQKSWFVHNPPPRDKDVLLHPAKFPESLARQFIEFFTKRGEVVLDPMAGTGSALIAAWRAGRVAVGVELNPRYVQIARSRVATEAAACDRELTDTDGTVPPPLVLQADARDLDKLDLPPVNYCITSPPYWDMLHRPGFETQARRRKGGLDVTYSADPRDLSNIGDYDRFLDELATIYFKVHARLTESAYLTVIVKNVKKGGRIYPLAWDLARKLGQLYALKDERIWLQDNQKLAPYGMFSAWVSNTFHHYCLNFRKE